MEKFENVSPNELRARREQKLSEARAAISPAEKEKRALTADETAKYQAALDEVDQIDESMKRALDGGGRKCPPQADSGLGLDRRDVEKFSILNVYRALYSGDMREARHEWELSREYNKKLGRSVEAGRFSIVPEVLARRRGGERRDLTIGTEGADVKMTTIDPNFVELLRNHMVLAQLGITVVGGLVGDWQIPKQSGGSTAAWLAEQGAASESTPTTGNVTLQPKTVSAWMDMSRKFINQSSVDAEAFAENDLALTLALAMDLAGIHGSGSANEPTGIASTSGINEFEAADPNGGALDWSDIVRMETEVATDNADRGKLAYLTNAQVRGKLKNTVKVSSTDSVMIWTDGDKPLNGYRALVSNQVKSNLTKASGSNLSAIFFGNWADLVMGLWGTLDLIRDPFTASTKGDLRVVAFQDCDFVVRHPESFCMINDIVTT